jgi:hypothetical protein
MADNSVFDPGAGGDTYRSKDRAGVKTEIVGLDIGIGGTETLMTAAALADTTSNPTTAPWAGMLMCFNGTTWDRVRGDTTNGIFANVKTSVLPTGASTAAKQPALGTAGTPSADVITVQGVTSMTALKVDGSGVTQPVSGTVTANLSSANVTNAGTFAVQDSQKVVDNAGFTDGTTPVNPVGFVFDEVAGTALTENDAAAARVDSKRAQVLVLEDATTRGRRATVSAGGAVLTDASATTQPVSGTVSITANSAVNVAQVAGTATDTNSGVKSAGTQRMVLATDQPQLTNALKVDGSAVTQPISSAVGSPAFVTPTPSTTGGWTPTIATAQTTTVKAIKSSAAGTFGGYYIFNPNSAAAYVQVFDVATAGAVTLGSTTPTMVYCIPGNASGGAAANVEYSNGVHMANGIQLACTTTATGSTAPATGLDMTILFK